MYPASETYPGADTTHESRASHPGRSETWGVVIHYTVGHEAGDIATLTGGSVDVQFYVTKAGKVYQFLAAGSQAWHAFATANHYCVGIETEGSGEAWTPEQLAAVGKLCNWLSKKYGIPVKHVQPVAGNPESFHGFMDHRDLSATHIDGNDHNDGVPVGTGWNALIAAINRGGVALATRYYFEDLPWPRGNAPRQLGPWPKKGRDLTLKMLQALGRTVTAWNDQGKYKILWWKKGTYGTWWRSKPYDVKADRDREQVKREKNLGRKIRPFSRLVDVSR